MILKKKLIYLDSNDVRNFLLNIDAEEEGVFIAGCAGGIMAYPEINAAEFELNHLNYFC